MTIQAKLFNGMIRTLDIYKDLCNPLPQNITIIRDIPYTNARNHDHTLNIYYPERAQKNLPVIINVHGGGYVYSNKETYDTYCMKLATYGFAVIGYDYRLAPKMKYPTPLIDLNDCMLWLERHAEEYQLNINQLFMLGDSAGAQILGQYVTAMQNDDYGALFQMTYPNISVKGIAFNCGFFNAIDRALIKKHSFMKFMVRGLMEDYIGKDFHEKMDEMNFETFMTHQFPPTFVANSVNDLLVGTAPDILLNLRHNNIRTIYREYARGDFFAMHNFQMDIRRKNAVQCIEDEIAFFNTIRHEKTG